MRLASQSLLTLCRFFQYNPTSHDNRANRLIATPNTSYAYDGLGNRVAQTVNSVLTEYLNDLQPALPKLLQEVTASDTTRYIHSLRGIHSMERPTAVGNAVWGTSTWGDFKWGATPSGVLWEQFLQDGLGSVRAIADAAGVIQQNFDYDPYGELLGASASGFLFTGEYRDESGLQYHRARYYDPMMSIFPSLDPFEGIYSRPMSLNGYSWVEGNVVMNTDPNGAIAIGNQCLGSIFPFFGQNNQYYQIDGRTPCPTPGGSNLNVTTAADNEWLTEFGFCRNGVIDQRLSLIGYNIRARYGIHFIELNTTTDWDWNSLASVARGLWLIEKALKEYPQTSPYDQLWSSKGDAARAMRDMFSGTLMHIYRGGYLANLSSIFAYAAIEQGSAAAVAPPPGIYSQVTGNNIFFAPNRTPTYSTVIHELGHILDYKLGSTFNSSVLSEPDVPSTALLNFTGSSYASSSVCATLTGSDWGICVATRGEVTSANLLDRSLGSLQNPNPRTDAGYLPSGSAPRYGSGNPDDHFEDFAASWEEWVLERTAPLHNPIYTGRMDNIRRSFMTDNVWRWFANI